MGNSNQAPRIGVNLSAGTTRALTGTVVLSNAGGLRFGAQLSNSSYVITASAGISAGLQSISAGATRVTSGAAVLSHGGGVSFGISGGNTITADPFRISYWDNGRFYDGACEQASAYTASNDQATAPIGALFQRVEFQAPMRATRIDLERNVSFSIPASWDITPGQYMIGIATTSNSVSFGVYTMTGSTAYLVSMASRTDAPGNPIGLRGWSVPGGQTDMQAVGGNTGVYYWADGTYMYQTLPTSSVHITDIRQTLAGVNVNGLTLFNHLNVGLNVPYFQLAGS